MDHLDSLEAAAMAPAMPAARAGEGVLQHRVHALEELLGVSHDRLDAGALDQAGQVLGRIAERRRLSLDHTVVALAGATGSGKSTLFNALVGLELSRTGVRRPTTGAPIACAWDPQGSGPLLDRLGILPQNRFSRQGTLLDGASVPPALSGHQGPCPAQVAPTVPGTRNGYGSYGVSPDHDAGGGYAGNGWYPEHPAYQARDEYGRYGEHRSHGRRPGTAEAPGLILIDLPDHDSAAVQHRRQVDRLLTLVDAVVWVLDPEKYADAALHERYLRPLAGHADVTVVVLNQVDRLPAEVADQVLDDLRRLLDEDGLALGEHGESGAAVLAASALIGEGVADVRAVIQQLAAERQAAGRRLAADAEQAVARLRPAYVGSGAAGLTDPVRQEFLDRLADAVGARAAGQTAGRQWALAARRACAVAWPRRPRVGQATAPGPAPVAARPVVEEAVRTLAEAASSGLPQPWAQAVRDVACNGGRGLPEQMETAVARARSEEPGPPRWWAVAGGVQWLLMALGVVATAVLVVTAAGAPAGPVGTAVWASAAMLVAATVGGPVLALFCGAASRGAAQRHGRWVEEGLRRAVADCGWRQVLDPVDAELLRYRQVREKYGAAVGRSAVS